DSPNCSVLHSQEPSTKRVRPLARVTSLANLISPVRNGAVRRFGQTIQSFALRSDSKSPGCGQKSCSRSAAPTPPKRRNSVLWSETLDVNTKESLSTKEIKRQEAIYEMSRGEQDLIEDLKLARKAYHDPMLKLSIMSEEELTHIFGDLDSYIPLHEDLVASLGAATKPDGTVEQIGPILVKWLPRLQAYRGYCSNQLAAKALLDQKKQDRRVQDFLQRCLESPFSRKLDLWSFLDIPRSRLVKYPLLLREILRHTPQEHPDIPILEEAISIIQGVLSDINVKKGESECQYYMDKLEYLDEKQRDPRIQGSKALLCHGELRNKNGHVRLVLAGEGIAPDPGIKHHSLLRDQWNNQPVPSQAVPDLGRMEDCGGISEGICGRFPGSEVPVAVSIPGRNMFRVRSREPCPGHSHTLQATDVFHKQQWLSCLRSAIAPFHSHIPSPESRENNPSLPNLPLPAGISHMELESGGSGPESQEPKGVDTHTASPGHRKSREKQPGGKRKETLV
ncbi:ARHG8 protein, partial [Smithornis capensis]|nr:ARHG8 protein [Smithornis capensis]